jgi:hypothetical protein
MACTALPHNKGTTMRTVKHIYALINIVALTKSQFKIDFGDIEEKQIIARQEDAAEVLLMTSDSISSKYVGVPTHKVLKKHV